MHCTSTRKIPTPFPNVVQSADLDKCVGFSNFVGNATTGPFHKFCNQSLMGSGREFWMSRLAQARSDRHQIRANPYRKPSVHKLVGVVGAGASHYAGRTRADTALCSRLNTLTSHLNVLHDLPWLAGSIWKQLAPTLATIARILTYCAL